MRQIKDSLASFVFAMLVCLAPAAVCPAADLNLIPWPKTIQVEQGDLVLTRDSRIVAQDAALLPLAKVLASEFLLVAGIAPATAQGQAKTGDIVLKLDPALKGEAYSLEVQDSAVVAGGNYNAVAMGTVTLQQALTAKDGKLSLPKLKIADQPDYKMRAIQMCIKHQYHQMSKIKQGVDICRQYKLNTLALHNSNFQILWLLCPAFRENPSFGNPDGGALYSPEEWKDLVEYARQRGVAILPEWGPVDFVHFLQGWFYKARQFVPDFDETKQTLLDSPKYWAAIDEMTGQLVEIFHTSEYIHVGALDGETGALETEQDKALMQREGLRNSGDVWAWVLKRFYEINKKHGKQTMVFEGVNADSAAHVKLPKEVAFFAYQTWYYPADAMIADGYRVLNAAWRPLYTCGGYPAHEIYNWNPRILWHNIDPNINVQLPKSDLLLGSLLSTWEGGEIGHMELLTDRGAAMAERCWNEKAGKTWKDFSRRLKPTMARLAAIQYPMGITLGGLLDETVLPPGWPSPGRECFGDKLTITMKPNVPDVKVYYTVSDTGRPGPANAASKLYDGPLTFADNGPGAFRAQCFDAAGKPVGGEYVKIFVPFPIQMTIEGADEKYDSWGRYQGRFFKAYREKAVVKFSTPTGEKLRYRTTPPGAQPATPDLEYTGPITINKATSFWVGKGKEGYQLITGIGDDGYTPNLLTDPGVEVTVEPTGIGDKKFIVDGYADPNSHWNGLGQPAWAKFKLPKARKINKLEVFCWWGDGRAYRYNVEVSMTGKDGDWKQIVDMKQNTKPAEGAYSHTFDPIEVQFIRINMFGNTTNGHNHLCEVRAYAAEQK